MHVCVFGLVSLGDEVSGELVSDEDESGGHEHGVGGVGVFHE